MRSSLRGFSARSDILDFTNSTHMAREEKSSVDSLKSELYSRTTSERVGVSTDIRSPLSPAPKEDVPHVWTAEPEAAPDSSQPPVPPIARLLETESDSGWSLPAKFLVASFGFFVLAVGVAAYLFFGGRNTISGQNIDITLLAPSLIDGGKAATIQVIVGNRNTAALTLADLLVDYPDGTRDANDPTQTLTHERLRIGTIPSGGQSKQALNAQFYGQQGVAETVHVTLEYTIEGSNAVFQKPADVSFVVGSSPVSVAVDAPSEVISGQEFQMDLSVAASGANPVNDVVLQAQFPSGFSLSSSSPTAAPGGQLWRLGTLTPGTPQVIHLTGTLLGQDGDERVFRFLSGSDNNPTDVAVAVPFLSIPTSIAIHQPFITATIALNGETGKPTVATPGNAVSGVITWQNNLSTTVSNASLKLSFSGDMIDPTSISAPEGFYQSSDNTVTWSPQTTQGLDTIAAGGRGSVTFTFTPRAAPNNTYVNPTLNLGLSIVGTRPSDSGAPTEVSSAAMARVLVASVVALTTQALHFSGPFQNGGPMPPKVGSNTSYTIEWTVQNSSNSIAQGRVTTALPPYVTFMHADDSSGITYDPTNRIVTWNLGSDVRPGVGFSAPSRQADFEVALTPSISQKYQNPDLTGTATFVGQDRFTQTPVAVQAPSPTTKLTGDSGYTNDMGIVAP